MKKTFLYLALALFAVTSCRKDENILEPEVSIETQNGYDDVAAKKFLETHYFDAKGKVQVLADKDTVNVKLSDLSPVTLPSGVIYVMRPGAQPENGTVMGDADKISLMHISTSYVATDTEGKVMFTSPAVFGNTIAGSGIPQFDPLFYYAKKSVLDKAVNDVAKKRNFYEIEGFREALQKFQAFDKDDASDYNLQGLIIVPSRAAFARDPHYNYTGMGYRNRSFIFNFQVYRSVAATDPR